METSKEQSHSSASDKGFKHAERSNEPALPLQESLDKLSKLGGFDLLETTIDGLQNLNPERKARKQIFLTDDEKAGERQDLKQKLNQWIKAFEDGASVSDMIESCGEKLKDADANLNTNLRNVLDSTRELERAYRTVHLFYKNTETDKLKNLVVMNADLDQLKELDNPRFIEYAANELKQNYDRLDLRQNYSIMVIPGYLGSNKVVERWSKMAFENKVMLVTDFADLDQPDDVIDLFTSANLTGGDAFKSNTIMTCNWMVGRGKVDEVGETEDLFVPGSAALAGKMYHTLMSQVTAGKKHGAINEVEWGTF